MENTLSNKARFFAQYLGQEVIFHPRLTTLVGLTGSVIDNVRHDMAAEYHSYITLKPLSSISDEDTRDLAELIYGTSFNSEKGHVSNVYQIALTEKFVAELEKTPMSLGNKIEIIDFLRSKGYALPFLGLSVEKAIEYGWVKLNNRTS